MAPLSSSNLPSGTEEIATVVHVGVNQACPRLHLVVDHDSSELTIDVELNPTTRSLHLFMKLNFPGTIWEVMLDQNINNQGWWFGICGLMEHVKGWFIKSVPDITLVKVSAKFTSGEETLFNLQEVSLKEFDEELAKYPQWEDMVRKGLLNQTEKLKLCSQCTNAALRKKPAEENKEEEYKLPYNFLASVIPVVGWGLTNVMSEGTIKLFQDFPHKWMHSVAALAINLGSFAMVGAWAMQKRSSFLSKCLLGAGLTFLFVGALFCQAPLLAQLL